MKPDGFSAGSGVIPVRIEAAGDHFAAFFKRIDQVAFHQAQPVTVYIDFVRGIDSGDRVFTILDGGQCGFQNDILHAGRGHAADRVAGIDLQFNMQAVAAQQNEVGVTFFGKAGKLLRAHEAGVAAIF